MVNRFVGWAPLTKKSYVKSSWWAMPTLRLVTMLLCCIASGCSILIPGPGLDDFPLTGSSFIIAPQILQQKITVSFGEKQIALIGITELTQNKIKIAGLTDFGKRLLLVDYDGEKLNAEIEPMLAEYFSGRDILLHYQMAYWPEIDLKHTLSSSEWDLVAKGGVRDFIYQGDVIYRADNDEELPAVADAKVCNLAAGYCLKFENLVSNE